MMIIDAKCWQCDEDVLVALVGDDAGNLGYGPEAFSVEEQKLAKEHGVLLKNVDSSTANESYLANACTHCGAFVGKWYFFTDYYTTALYGHYTYKRV